MSGSDNYNSSAYIVLKPGYASILINAARQFKAFGLSLLLVSLAYVLINYIFSIPTYLLDFPYNTGSQFSSDPYLFPDNFGWYMLYTVLFALIAGVLFYGYAFATLKAARGEKPFIMDLFQPFKRFFTVIFSGIILYLIIALGTLFFIIPGIFFLCRLVFVPYLVMDQKAGVFEAFEKSWVMTKGHFWEIFLLGLTIIIISTVLFVPLMLFWVFVVMLTAEFSNLWIFQSIITLISIPFSMYIMLTVGSLYHAIRLEKTQPIQPIQPIME